MSRLDYCNTVLAELPKSTLEPLQRVQNAAARLEFGLRLLPPRHAKHNLALLAASQLQSQISSNSVAIS